jgi:nucleoside-diphosphate-sugar epimerase
MPLLITGGTGFIGSYVVRDLVKKGQKVVLYDLYPDIDAIKDILANVTIVHGDVRDLIYLLRTMRTFNIDYIIHLAYLLPPATEEDPKRALEINCLGTINVFEAARLNDVKRVVWASSTAVYGLAKDYNYQIVNEDSPLKPTTVYGASKVSNEFVSEHYASKYGLNVIGLRPTIVYGFGRKRGMFNFANDIIEKAALHQKVKVPYGDQELDWVYVKDISKVFIDACYVKKPVHRIFNIGGYRCKVKDVAKLVKKFIPDAEIIVESGSLGWVSKYDMSRAKEELGYSPIYDLEAGIKDILRMAKASGRDNTC